MTVRDQNRLNEAAIEAMCIFSLFGTYVVMVVGTKSVYSMSNGAISVDTMVFPMREMREIHDFEALTMMKNDERSISEPC